MNERPSSLSSKELRFQPQTAVRWLSTRVLAGTAGRMILAQVLNAYLDRREVQAISEQGRFDHSLGDEVWLDFIADSGDGFDSTYTIAYLASQPELDLGGSLPRGSITVMGGDEVYPAANWRDYENKFKGPFQAALPEGDGALYAIPGNHDWFDGLTAFLRVFAAGRDIGGRSTYQKRSYWAARLPHRWWLLGIDAQFDAYFDQPQLQYFTEALQDMEPGDQVILCVPRPTWTLTKADPRAFDRYDYFIRTVIEPKGGEVPLILTGDRHHYSHYREVEGGGDRHLVTAGGGGAYMSGTHTLPSRITAPPPESMQRHGSEPRTYTRGVCYPDRRQSWRQAMKIFWRMPLRNPSFLVLLGIIHLFGLVSFLNSTGTAVAAAAVTLGITIAFAYPSAGSRTLKYWLAAGGHAAVHLGLTTLGAFTYAEFGFSGWASYVAYVPISGILASVVVSAYLVIAGRFGVNDNELFAGQSIDDYKCFLRLRIDGEGVTVHPIGVHRVGRRWRANPQGTGGDSWIEPETPIKPHFIEKPYTIPGKSQTGINRTV
ncbi:MAG TPA: hypothetical protein VE172_20230 [Stackebrandtia sp.]|jgi:hypothetical protein|uniref:hypothetical protein n=1 Tax=Stackebrandtia sp. TaxID=2023065 RepID=UPI002D5B70E4|nr:hypothetical protein [Stackebrandtia sp.]HZE41134.1 hypothetical protein [Stackebrandtia sp.]